ncbi:MAG TPA: hypothetical protein VHR27_19135, partial [Blastocatellia bacterium]|nr:hypothetical protein [Blastocatellia bacterium]
MSDGRNVGIHLVPGDLLADRYKITRYISSSVFRSIYLTEELNEDFNSVIGIGSIYLAEDLKLASLPVTVKEITEMVAGDAPPLRIEKWVNRELELVAGFYHPSILT